MFLGLRGQPLLLTFQATYNGPYKVDAGPLGLGNVPQSDRVFWAKYYQLAYYNRPLTFEEWEERVGHAIFVSATPGPYELQSTEGEVVEQIVRPTGLMSPAWRCAPRETRWTTC